MNRPTEWIEEDREEVVETIVNGMIAEMTFEEMRKHVWDMLYENLIWQDWSDLEMHMERFG